MLILPVIRGVTGQGPVAHKGGGTTSIQIDGIDHILSQQELCHLPQVDAVQRGDGAESPRALA